MNIIVPTASQAPIFNFLGATFKLEKAPHNRFKCSQCSNSIKKDTTHVTMVVEFFQAEKTKRVCNLCAPEQMIQMQINCREFEKRLTAVNGNNLFG